MSQPAVAEQIRKLEQALGADLFVRAGRGVVPTDAGRAFAEHAARSLRAARGRRRQRRRAHRAPSGTVALGIFSGPSAWRLDELVAAFLRRHPRRVRPARRPQLLGDRRARPARRARGRRRAAADRRRPARRAPDRARRGALRQRRPRAHAPAGHDRAARRRRRWSSTTPSPPTSDPIRRQLAERAQALGLRLRPRVEVELKDLALRLVAAGVGDTYLPSAYTRAPYYPAGPDHRVVQPAALRHVRDRHPRRARGSRPACASCSPTSRRTCGRSRSGSTARAERHRVGR